MATDCSVLGIPELEHPWGLHWAPGLATILREVTVPRERTDPHHSLLERELVVLKSWPCPEGAHSPEPGPCPRRTQRGAGEPSPEMTVLKPQVLREPGDQKSRTCPRGTRSPETWPCPLGDHSPKFCVPADAELSPEDTIVRGRMHEGAMSGPHVETDL